METAERPSTAAGAVVLERYELRERLGEGGFGTVWLAHDQRLDREVAVKRIPIARGAAKRAEREALAAARLSHPSIVALFEAGRDGEAVYLVSELVRGATLGELLAEGALSDRDVLRIGTALCDALAHAHARGVVHRDVKPGNVLIPDAVADGVIAKLTDFGIARMAGDDALTATGDVVGTIAYMAPEQAEGRGATAASDLYALGLVLYEALSGVNPVRQAGAAATARRVGMRMPPLRRLRRDLPRALCAALDAAVLADPAMRGSIPSLRDALAEAIPDAGDEPGTVEEPRWSAMASQTLAVAAHTRAWRAEGPEDDGPAGEVEDADEVQRGPLRVPLQGRAATALLTGAMVAALLPLAATGPQLDPLAAAALSAAATALLPRLGWLATSIALTTWLAASGQDGPALLVATAAIPIPLLLPLRGTWWSAPALAVAAGIAGLGGIWPAVAGQARGLLTRAALGAAGWWWIVLAESVRHERLLSGPPAAARPSGSVAPAASVHAAQPAGTSLHAAGDALAATVQSGTIATAALWALGAALLPLLVRGRNAALDLLAAAAWAAGLALGGQAIARAAHAPEPRGLVAAAALGALAAVAARAVARRP